MNVYNFLLACCVLIVQELEICNKQTCFSTEGRFTLVTKIYGNKVLSVEFVTSVRNALGQ